MSKTKAIVRSNRKAPSPRPARRATQRPTRRTVRTRKPPIRPTKAGYRAWLLPWRGRFGGLPGFGDLALRDVEQAFRTAMTAFRAEVRAITSDKRAPTFANTLVPLERAGAEFGRVNSLFGLHCSALATPEAQAIERKLAPKLAAFGDELILNRRLFARIAKVHESDRKGLAPEAHRLVEVTYDAFVRQGAKLRGSDAKRLSVINQELATLYTTFAQNQLADEETQVLELTADELVGIPEALVASTPPTTSTLGTVWRFANTRSVMEPILTYAQRRDVRQRAHILFTSRGESPERDNRPLAQRILQLRTEKARLLGFPSAAHATLSSSMAKSPETALAALMAVWPAAVAAVQRDEATMRARLQVDHGTAAVMEPWDYRYYAEALRRAAAFDEKELAPYLSLPSLRDALFWMAKKNYGLEFRRAKDVGAYHPDVEIYEVMRSSKRVGVFTFDPYARPGKRSGAWMSELRTGSRISGLTTPIVTNTCNFVAPAVGARPAISWDDVTTLFHEFGHALHGLLTQTKFPSLAGTNTLRDFVELPSQLHEHWAATSDLLDRFARHADTGEPMPAALREKVAAARRVGQGFRTVEYLASALFDLRVHLAAAHGAVDVDAFEASLMSELGCPRSVVMRHRPAHFGHIFSGDGYASGYYSYLWADVLTADAAEAFREAGSYYHRATARRLEATILSVGNSVPPDVAYRAFRGRDPDPAALLRDRGFQ